MVAGLVFVLLNREPTDLFEDPPPQNTETVTTPEPVKTEKDASPIQLKSVTLKREGDHYLSEVTISFDNQSDTEVRTVDSAKLVTDSGKTIPIFFLAFTGIPPVLPAEKKSDATLRFNLLPEDIVGQLTLDISGHRAEIKSARSFDPESIAEKQSMTFKQLDW